MVYTVWLTTANADFNIMGKARLTASAINSLLGNERWEPTLIAACNDLAISLSWSSLGLLPRISGSQYWPMAPFMWAILPCDGTGALTHCDGSRPTPQTI